jgi:hypothetical protein
MDSAAGCLPCTGPPSAGGRLTGCASCGHKFSAARGLRAGGLRLLVAAEREAGGADIFPAVAGFDGCVPLAGQRGQ